MGSVAPCALVPRATLAATLPSHAWAAMSGTGPRAAQRRSTDMQTKDHIAAGTTSLQHPTTPITSMGAHTAAPPRAATPPRTGAHANRGGGAWPLGNAR